MAVKRRIAESEAERDGDTATVTDPQTRVKGIDGLRVVDASLMPSMVSSNPNAVVMMMAEHASDMILGNPLLTPSDAPFHIADVV